MSKTWQIKNYLLHLWQAKRGGHGVHSPFVYKLVENVLSNQHSFYAFDELDKLRSELNKDSTELDINDLGAGSQKLGNEKRKVRDIATHGISSKKQAELLFKLISYFRSEVVIELGTSIGLTSMYLSYAAANGKIYTLEGSGSLADFASRLFKDHKRSNITCIQGDFDQTLPKLLDQLNTFDLMYIDGNHTYEATLRYFELACQKTNEDSVIIFDDIYWSKEMTRAWEEIKANDRVRLSVDCFYFGMIFFRNAQKQKEHFKLFI